MSRPLGSDIEFGSQQLDLSAPKERQAAGTSASAKEKDLAQTVLVSSMLLNSPLS